MFASDIFLYFNFYVSVIDQFSLERKVALISGGNRGLGYEIAKALGEAGASLAIAARDSQRNKDAIEKLREIGGGKCVGLTCDVTDEKQVSETVEKTVDEYGRIDILINSAGINIRGLIEKLDLEEFRQVQEVNVTGTWLMCRAAAPFMKKNNYGRVINIGSTLSLVAFPERTPYATSKGAVLNLTRALAMEWATSGITVNAVLPGAFATEMNLPLLNDPEKYKASISKIPMGRWGKLHEIGGIALFLASDAASYVTGASFVVDGGWTAQ